MRYLKQLIGANTGVSSKRFISLYCLLLFTGVVVCDLLQIRVQVEIIYALVSLILGCSAMTLTQNKGNDNTNDNEKNYYNRREDENI